VKLSRLRESEGKPGEKELFEDALVIHDYAERRPEVSPGPIVAMGRSLGSGVAVHLAAHRPLRAVILVSPYDSIVEVAKRHYPFCRLAHAPGTASIRSPAWPQIEAPLLALFATEDRVSRWRARARCSKPARREDLARSSALRSRQHRR